MKQVNDVNSQMRAELGESTVVGAATAANLKFGLIAPRMDKNFWRSVIRPFWYGFEKDEKGRDIWQQKKTDFLAEVSRLARKQIKEMSRAQGRGPTFQPRSKPTTFQQIEKRQQPRLNRWAKQAQKQAQPGLTLQPLLDKYRRTT